MEGGDALLILKLVSVDTLASHSIPSRKVTSLDHEPANDPTHTDERKEPMSMHPNSRRSRHGRTCGTCSP